MPQLLPDVPLLLPGVPSLLPDVPMLLPDVLMLIVPVVPVVSLRSLRQSCCPSGVTDALRPPESAVVTASSTADQRLQTPAEPVVPNPVASRYSSVVVPCQKR